MRAWTGWVGIAAMPWLLAACTDDATSVTSDEDSSGGPVGSTTVDPTTGEPPTTTTPPPMTSESGPPPSDESTSEPPPPPPPTCGNNVIEGDEVCDLTQINDETCASLGYEGGVLACLLDCSAYNLLGCYICGNEIVDMQEDCEGEVPDDVDCESLGFEAGTVTCDPKECLFDTSDCSICGDGIRSGPEQCDGIDFGGATCQSVGFAAGFLACNVGACAYDYTGCSGGMFTQDFEGLANIPPEFTVANFDPWTIEDAMPINGAQSARAGAVAAGGISTITLQAQFPAAGSISFDHEESCPQFEDYLEFYVDGVFQMSWTGILAASNFNMPVDAGMHTFSWQYNRSGFSNAGENTVWIDDVTLVGGVPL